MYLLLISIGLLCIAVGFYNLNKIKDEDSISKSSENKDIIKDKDIFQNVLSDNFKYDLLEERVNQLEKIILDDSILIEKDFQNIKEMVIKGNANLKSLSIDKNFDIENESIKKYLKIKELEESGNNTEEICKRLHMNKGEVLLLKKLYKEY